MLLDKITIEYQRWGKDEGKYTGSISFRGEEGDIACKLDTSVSAKFLMLASDIIIDTAKTAQDSLVKEIEESISKAMTKCTALEFKADNNEA